MGETTIMDVYVREILRKKGNSVLTIDPNATVFEAIASMTKENVGSIVVTEGTSIVGIFTERDYLRRIALRRRPPKKTPIREVMTDEVVTVGPTTTVEHCMAMMTNYRCRHLPVVEDGTLNGIISIGDCVKHLSRKAMTRVQTLEEYISGRYPA